MNEQFQSFNPRESMGRPRESFQKKSPNSVEATTEKATTVKEEEEEQEDTNDPQLASRTLHPQMGGE